MTDVPPRRTKPAKFVRTVLRSQDTRTDSLGAVHVLGCGHVRPHATTRVATDADLRARYLHCACMVGAKLPPPTGDSDG